jgi:hypothetical protein
MSCRDRRAQIYRDSSRKQQATNIKISSMARIAILQRLLPNRLPKKWFDESEQRDKWKLW